MFSFEKSISINKSPHEVFRFVTNPLNNHKWREDVIATRIDTLPMHIGDKVEETIEMNGPHTCVAEVVELLPDQKIVLAARSGKDYLPNRMLKFEGEGNHTKVTARISMQTDGFTRLIQPLSSNMFSTKWDVYLFNLKKVLEAA